MPWYVWLILILVFGSVIGSLLALRDAAKKLPLTKEQLERIRQRNAELDAREQREKER
ncbi:DUF2897 family protein [Azotobacter chroococcum]|jgi:hypothetical protein|uniref:DUF2897 domain-containing protein n=2 Tax=Azotobacter chroococcum TaxID=353 RepID=A0A0C4WIN3_9GAMM|nr:DUF2897 family protein [Azotobacter chroococcum]AJE22188.1 Hypothetical protein Achr_27650 [Azotobacter chroococcum NCIMB 8003]QQE89954.1 DUF2897 family protein [Azotobacter chroococcum]TBV99986.1 DUF2897 family protein [Azotobacter chroococcum]TBW33733.1 DUF2897 family protein [Azotobacter chroococcum]TCL31707.1 DUF2897 family protein [Azotobacter chroococcum]